ncbi:hypothetical protein L596_029771 [Steinernema carpocapsae]|uniref:Acyl-CoA thioesterase-like C-terminal domain-containing protein n=1 Tax=Steinernema carpocapsae TaxID=34508 RepID=A0A4U5LQS7_STECR|nr:hypothetical protein L596_029771 [Steinernema carpocapsae]
MSITSENKSLILDSFSGIFKLQKEARNVARSEAPHMGGIYSPVRLFGGQTAAQFQLAFRKLFSKLVVHTLKVNFIGPGNLKDPISYDFHRVPGTNFAIANAVQNKKNIATAKIRYGPSSDLLDQSPYFMPLIRNPLSYGSLRERLHFKDEFTQKLLRQFSVKSFIFDIRPVDFKQLTHMRNPFEPILLWCTLTSLHKKSRVPMDGPTVISILGDCMMVFNARLQIMNLAKITEFAAGASLNHTIWFHAMEGIDPKGWFLYETRCNRISNTNSVIEGRIFDEKGKCLMTVLQECYLKAKM